MTVVKLNTMPLLPTAAAGVVAIVTNPTTQLVRKRRKNP